MRYFFSALSTIAWALWFGGVVALILFIVGVLVQTFVEPRKDLFAEAAVRTFLVFERYQLVVGAVALLGAFALRMINPGASRTALFCVLSLAAAAACVSSFVITPKIIRYYTQQVEARRLEQTPDVASVREFQRAHGLSHIVYSAQAALLLAAGALLPLAVKDNREIREET